MNFSHSYAFAFFLSKVHIHSSSLIYVLWCFLFVLAFKWHGWCVHFVMNIIKNLRKAHCTIQIDRADLKRVVLNSTVMKEAVQQRIDGKKRRRTQHQQQTNKYYERKTLCRHINRMYVQPFCIDYCGIGRESIKTRSFFLFILFYLLDSWSF